MLAVARPTKAPSIGREREIKVYGVIRACRRGFKIGPLFADNEEAADLLFRGLVANANGSLSTWIVLNRTAQQ